MYVLLEFGVVLGVSVGIEATRDFEFVNYSAFDS
jgi:hypothetical protein